MGSEELSLSSMKVTSRNQRSTSILISRPYYSVSVCSMHLFWEERSSDHKAGQETTISMTVILEFVVIFFTTILVTMRRFHGQISDTCSDKLCMVVISQTIGTEEQTKLI